MNNNKTTEDMTTEQLRREELVDRLIDLAIDEDIASGDVTTDSIIPESTAAVATMTAKADGVISGLPIVEKVFRRFQKDIVFKPRVHDGDSVCKGDVILRVEGSYPALLKAERTALNFFQRMSGIATETARYVAELKGTHTRLLDTRKTAPGMRVTDKMAVRDGGGTNHRMGLYDMAMIKDNHIKMAGSIALAVEQVRSRIPSGIKVEVEASNLDEVKEALDARADIIMLDNMSVPMMRDAVNIIGGRAKTEASGNMTLGRLREVAETGVDYISVGALTHTVKALDISMNIQLTPEYLVKAIGELKRRHNAVILAHYYVSPEVQDVADFVGDSLELSRKAAGTDADVIVFCGVRFMGETAAVLCPGKKVLLPVPDAGCSLADGVTGAELEEWKRRHKDGTVISYVNTTADAKAFTDICCTSANAVQVARHVAEANPESRIIFVPDRNLGAYINRSAGLKMDLWKGCCHVHDRFTSDVILDMAEKYPDAEILIHPESKCSSDDRILEHDRCFFFSTSGMLRHVRESSCRQFVIATEPGVIHRLRQQSPDREFIPVDETNICEYMKRITLLNLFETLLHFRNEVTVPEDTASRAVVPVSRMLEL